MFVSLPQSVAAYRRRPTSCANAAIGGPALVDPATPGARSPTMLRTVPATLRLYH